VRIVVLGATGQIGSPLVTALEDRGHDVVRASRATGVDARTGTGLDAAFEGADVVVDALNPQTRGKRPTVDFFATTAQHVVTAARRTRVGHLVVVSIWNATHPDAVGYGYYAGKAAQERAYQDSGLPVTIVRSTQWYELAETLVSAARLGPIALAPHMIARPLAVDAAAHAVAAVCEAAPDPDGVVLAGPQRRDLFDLARRIAGGHPRLVAVNPPGMRAFARGVLLPPDDVPGIGPTFDEWLATRA
jgi:uncharacterized protein YbjT (DUF2867 family)